MKNVFFYLLCSISLMGFSQFDYGFKAGISFNSPGEITNGLGDFEAAGNSIENASGFSIGAYGSIDLLLVYIRPELQFTRYNQNFESIAYKQSKIELPVSVGYKVLPFLSLFAGPSLHYAISQNSSDINLEDLGDNKITYGAHFGARVAIGPLGVDLRYERGLKPNEIDFIQNNDINISGSLNTQPKQWVLGISYSLD